MWAVLVQTFQRQSLRAGGSTVDWDALTEALGAESIAACYSDVAPQEPLPDDHPLWSVPRLFLTPHSSGNPDGAVPGAGTPRYDAAMNAQFCAQLRRYLAGEEVFNVIDNALGY